MQRLIKKPLVGNVMDALDRAFAKSAVLIAINHSITQRLPSLRLQVQGVAIHCALFVESPPVGVLATYPVGIALAGDIFDAVSLGDGGVR